MSQRRLLTLTVAALILTASCGGSGITESDYDALVAERDAALNDIAEATAAVAEAEAATAEHMSQIEAMSAEAKRLQSEVDSLISSTSEADAAAEAAMAEADAAQAEVEALEARFDPEIRAALESEITVEVSRACDQAKEEYEKSISTIVSWSSGWELVTTRDALIEEVARCAAAERSKSVEQREKERLAACETVDVDALEKNPDKYRGECIHMWLRIVQYDSATGLCTFRAEMSPRKTSRWYDYDGNAMFSSATDPVCPELDDIDNNDFVEVWATGAGTLSYDTTAGGTATATVWRIEKIDLWRKD